MDKTIQYYKECFGMQLLRYRDISEVGTATRVCRVGSGATGGSGGGAMVWERRWRWRQCYGSGGGGRCTRPSTSSPPCPPASRKSTQTPSLGMALKPHTLRWSW